MQPSSRSPLLLSNFLSRSRNCLSEEQGSRSPSNQRSSSLGPKNANFNSHVAQKSRTGQVICLPKEYKPDAALESLEKLHGFFSKTFYVEKGRKLKGEAEMNEIDEETSMQNAFTNHIFTENFENRLKRKSDNRSFYYSTIMRKQDNQITCNYTEIISSRCTKELQVLGCLLVEIFLNKQLRTLGCSNANKISFKQRLKACSVVAETFRNIIPPCVKYLVNLLLGPDNFNLENYKYPSITDVGLPPPSSHLMLEPLLHIFIPFSPHFLNLYALISSLKAFKSATEELNLFYYQECVGQTCDEYENTERAKILLTQNIGECKVKSCAKNLEFLMKDLSTITDFEIVSVLLPHIKNLIEDPSTSVLAAWYLFDPIAKLLGPTKTSESLLLSVVRLFENEFSENAIFFNNKIAKLYHHHFLLCLIVRLGLKCFLDNFITPLVEAVGGYRDYEPTDFLFHTHAIKIVRKTSNLKSMTKEQNDISQSDDCSTDSEKNVATTTKDEQDDSKPEEIFECEVEDAQEDPLKSLIAHLELNVENDLPFDHSTAEEALDATLAENIDQLRNLEELNLNIDDEIITCDIGSKISDECLVDRHSNPSHFEIDLESPKSENVETRKIHYDAKISDMSADTLTWLSHRLGPVLTARYLTRNLLKMLTLCYVGKENLEFDSSQDVSLVSIAESDVVGDRNAVKVLECLSNIAALYGEQLILVQYFPHMTELISLCKRKLTQNLEGGLISCLALLKYIIPFVSDGALMDQLQDVILKNVLHPIVRLLGSTKYTFPNGSLARAVVARKYLDTVHLLTLRIGADMTRLHLAVPALQKFFMIFDKTDATSENVNPDVSIWRSLLCGCSE